MQNIAYFRMKILQSTVADELKREYQKRLAGMLNIDDTRIIEKTTDCQDPDFNFYQAPNTSYILFYIISDPYNENPTTSPINLVYELNNRRLEIQSFIPKLDTDPFDQMGELISNSLDWQDTPTFKETYVDTLSVEVIRSSALSNRFDSSRSTNVATYTLLLYLDLVPETGPQPTRP
jgi:hypothetical protein